MGLGNPIAKGCFLGAYLVTMSIEWILSSQDNTVESYIGRVTWLYCPCRAIEDQMILIYGVGQTLSR
jgi:hypothetical protein